MKLTSPSLVLTFLGGDLEPGHSSSQTIGECYLIENSFSFQNQRLNGLKSSSDQVSFKIARKCVSTEDIISTEGDIKAELYDGETKVFTGYVSTRFTWTVTDHGEEALSVTLESVGTRLLNKVYIETGKHFFSGSASSVLAAIVSSAGITIHSGEENKLTQNVSRTVEAGETCRDLLDSLCYECNAAYWFNSAGELCIFNITASTSGAPVFDKTKLLMVSKKALSLSKQLRTYKGARVSYKELGSAENYLIYRNTTGAGSGIPYCNLVLGADQYFDGGEIYTAQQWNEATEDEFREPTLIGAVNAESESEIVGSGEIVNISNLTQAVQKNEAISFSAEVAGGPYFKMLAHNTSKSYSAAISRLDLYADIVYVKSNGVIRTQIDGATSGKSILEEELKWIHDKENASKHANLLAQYYKSAAASYTFYSKQAITLGSVIELKDNVFSGLDVFVLVVSSQSTDQDGVFTYTAVGITTFDLTEDVYYGTTEEAKQSTNPAPASKWYNGTALIGTTYSRGAEGNVGDYYLNTETGNIYKCIQSGSATTALWQYEGNIKGKDASVDESTYEIEYALSTSPSEFIYPDGNLGYTGGDYGAQDPEDTTIEFGFEDIGGWSDLYSNWYKGLYVWQRIKTTDAEGNVTYGDPIYCEQLTLGLEQACQIDIVPNPKTFDYDPRNRGYQYIHTSLSSIGYKGTLMVTTQKGVFCTGEEVEGTWVWTVVGNTLTMSVNGAFSNDDYYLRLDYTNNEDVVLSGILTQWNLSVIQTSTTMSAVIKKPTPTQMATVYAFADLPEYSNKGSLDVNEGDYLVSGDYILVQFVTLAPDDGDYFDEVGNEWEYDENTVYYTRNDDVFTPVSIAAFDGTTTYYFYRIYPWMFNNGWRRTDDRSVKINTVSEIVSLARQQKTVDSSLDYHDCLIAYEAYIEELTVGLLNVGDILVNDIESSNYAEDENGVPTQGYKLSHNDGMIKAKGAKFIDVSIEGGGATIGGGATVYGLIQNKDENGDIVFSTNKDSGVSYSMAASKVDGSSSPNAYLHSEWKAAIKALLSNIASDTTLSASGTIYGTFNGVTGNHTLRGVRRVTSVPSGQDTISDETSNRSQNITKTVYTNTQGKNIEIAAIHITGSATWNRRGQTDYGDSRVIVYDENGNIYHDYGLNDDLASAYYYHVIVPIGGHIDAYWGASTLHNWGSQKGKIDITYRMDYDWTLGIWLIDSEGTGVNIDNCIPSSGYGTTGQVIIRGSLSASIVLSSGATWPNGVRKFYSNFAFSTTPQDSGGNPPSGTITTVILNNSSTFTYDGNSIEIASVTFSVNSLSITDVGGNTYTLNTGYHPAYSATIITAGDFLGVRTQSMMPVYKNGVLVGVGYVGSVAEPWNQVYADTIVPTSKRDRKTNIFDWEGAALELLKGVKICRFNYKSEIGNERCYTHYGFIADDTPEELATPFHDVMDLGNCIGVLIKAVQELSGRIEALEKGKKTN